MSSSRSFAAASKTLQSLRSKQAFKYCSDSLVHLLTVLKTGLADCNSSSENRAGERSGERLQRYQALNPMCNQANRWARRHQQGTSWLRSLKTCDVLPALAFCYSAKLSVCISHNLCLWVFLLLSVKLHQAFSSLPESSLWGGSFHQCSSRCWPRFRRGGAGSCTRGIRSWIWQREWRWVSPYLLPHLPNPLSVIWVQKPVLRPLPPGGWALRFSYLPLRGLMWSALMILPLSPHSMRSYLRCSLVRLLS